jgi:hypothetical protein
VSPKSALQWQSYPKLLSQINSTIESGRKHIEYTKALTYWQIGEHISKHFLKSNFYQQR